MANIQYEPIDPLLREILRPIARLRAWLFCNDVETPYNVTVRIVNNAALLTWRGDSTNVGAYYVERSENDGSYQGFVWVGAGAASGEHGFAWADTTINLGSLYCYRITAQHTNGIRGCPANPVCVQECNGLPIPFEVIGATWGNSEIRLWWRCDASNVDQYYIERSLKGLDAFEPLVTVEVHRQMGVQDYTYSDVLQFQAGRLYLYKIASGQRDGEKSCFSNPAHVIVYYE